MSPNDLNDLREERARALEAARAVLDFAEGEGRSELHAEEQEKYDKAMDDFGKLGQRIGRFEAVEAADAELSQRQANDTPPPSKPQQKAEHRDGDVDDSPYEFRYMVGENDRTMRSPIERTIPLDPRRATQAYGQSFRRYLKHKQVDERLSAEMRDLQADSQTAGGGVVPSEQFVSRLVKFVDDSVFIRGWATVIRLDRADSMGAPSYDNDPADADWSQEVPSALTADTTQSFGKRELHPWICTKLVKVSRKLLRVNAINLESFIRERLGYKLAVTHEKAFLTGSGANQPLGVFTASANGISTSRDVSTGNTTTAIGADGLIEAKYSLKAPYRGRPSTRWLFHRDGVKQIVKLKNADGDYIYRSGMNSNEPDMLLGIPVAESEFAPNTFTTGQYVGMLADWSNYWIADSLSMEVLRLDERYSDTLQVGFQLMAASDGMPVLEEAFARVTLA